MFDRYWQEWREEEDWFIREGVGILSQTEMGVELKRSPFAVKRRLYDLGLNSKHNNPWGVTMNWIQANSTVMAWVLRNYLARGEVAYLQGCKNKYIDLADLVGVVTEINWKTERGLSRQFKKLCRQSIMRRLCIVLSGRDYRKVLPYRFESRPLPKKTKQPTHVAVGDWIEVTGEKNHFARKCLAGRKGKVTKIYWSQSGYSRGVYKKKSAAQWMARVDFPSIRNWHEKKAGRCVSYLLPLLALKKIEVQKKRKKAA